MPLTQGCHFVEILSHDIRNIGDKEAVVLVALLPDGDTTDVLIFLTEKSMGIARRSLRLCGFDPDKQSLSDLTDNPELLKGRKVSILAEEWNGKIRANIMLNPEPTKKRVHALDSMLRAAKSDNEDPIPPATSTDEDLPF